MPHNVGMDWIRLPLRMAIYFRDDFDCIWCRQVFPLDLLGYGLTLDHLDPIGGNKPENLVTSCGACNSTRQDLPVKEWYKQLKANGYDIRCIQARVRRAIQKPVNLDLGKYIAAMRRPSCRVGVFGGE